MADQLHYRRTVRQTSLHRRPGAMHAADMVHLRHLNRSIPFYMLMSDTSSRRREEDEDGQAGGIDLRSAAQVEAEVMELGMLGAAWEREELLRVRPVHRAPVIRLTRTIDSVDDCDAYHNFRVLKEHMPRLFAALRFPEHVRLENGSTFRGEEAFLLLLMRMRYPGRLADLERYFGREYSQLSRLFRWATDFLFEMHSHRVMDNLEFWGPHLRGFARAVYRKGRAFGLTYDDICGFIDGTLRRFCRPGGHDDIQREVYDGHHRDHGLAYQAIMAPNGMLMDAWGPVSGRRHDSYLLRVSEFNPRLAAVQDPEGPQMKVYGDAAYPLLSHVRRGFKGSNLTDDQRAFNQANSKMRISVEWGFGKVIQLFPFCDFRKNQKLFLQPVARYYINACVLTNAHTCLRGSQTGAYFDMVPPTLEEYFA